MTPVLIAVPIVAAVALLISILARRYGQTRGPRPDHSTDGKVPIKIGGDLPTFNLIALGGQETGKTVLLASVFHRLTTEMSDGVFRLQTSLDQSVHLTNLYSTLENSKDWPPGTTLGETRSFTFECIGSAGGDEFPILNFNYLDYAGELLGGSNASQEVLDQRESRQKDLEQRIEAAHALFGIIDGQRMLDYLRGDPESRHYIENSITPMIGVMRKAKCPVHFILTKWDLFDGTAASDEVTDENERLAEVRDKLMSQDQIRNLVEHRRREKRIVRLIPVSAIGRQFAKVDAEGRMVKLKDGRLRPINIEIPLCAVLPDLFAQIEDQLDQANEEKIMAERRTRSRLTPRESMAALGKFLALPAGVALRAAADIAIGRSAFSDRIADMFIDWVGRPFDDKMARVDAAVNDARQQLIEMRLARSAVLREFSERMVVLKRQLPVSDLTGGSKP